MKYSLKKYCFNDTLLKHDKIIVLETIFEKAIKQCTFWTKRFNSKTGSHFLSKIRKRKVEHVNSSLTNKCLQTRFIADYKKGL